MVHPDQSLKKNRDNHLLKENQSIDMMILVDLRITCGLIVDKIESKNNWQKNCSKNADTPDRPDRAN